MKGPAGRLRAFLAAHRKAVILAVAALLFFLIGAATAPRSAVPLMCKIYG